MLQALRLAFPTTPTMEELTGLLDPMQYLRAQVHYHRLPCTTCTTYTLSRVCLEWQLCLGYTCLPGKHTLAQDQAVIQLGLTACLARGRPVGLETRTLFNVWMLAPWRFPWKVHEENA